MKLIDGCEVLRFQPSEILSCFAKCCDNRIENPSSPVVLLDVLSKTPTDDQILGWSANAPGFAEAVRSAKIKGELMKKPDGSESGSVLLEGLSDTTLDAIREGEIKGIFVWEHPLVLTKVSTQK